MRQRPDFNELIFTSDPPTGAEAAAEEQEALLGDEQDYRRTPYPPHSGSTFAPGHVPYAELPVYTTIHRSVDSMLQAFGLTDIEV